MGQAKWEKFTKEELKDKWFNCLTKREFAEQLGYNSSGHIKEIQEKIGLNDKDLGKNNSKQKKYIVGPKGSTIEDLTGKQFGHWKVLSLDINKTENDYHHSWWICQCDCDKQTIRSITMNNLKRGKTQSCGCDLIRAEDIIGEKFGKLKLSRNCLWGELIGSDANNRNKVIDSFDNSDEVISYNRLYEDHK